jgi:hypothetical protein
MNSCDEKLVENGIDCDKLNKDSVNWMDECQVNPDYRGVSVSFKRPMCSINSVEIKSLFQFEKENNLRLNSISLRKIGEDVYLADAYFISEVK